MPLIYACIAPHAGDLIPESISTPDPVARTRQSMQEMGAALQAFEPDVLVLVTPHGFRAEEALCLSIAERAFAEWAPGVKLDFEMDPSTANRIAERAKSLGVPLVRYIYGASGGPSCYIPLDWGAVVPLYFMGHSYTQKPGLVLASPLRTLPYQVHYDFGRAVAQVAQESELRIALVASADQSHAHQADGPYGYDPAAERYDAWMQEVLRSGQLDRLLSADPALVEAAKPDSLWPTLILAGALKENPLVGRLLSYEVNVYFGVLCAEFTGDKPV